MTSAADGRAGKAGTVFWLWPMTPFLHVPKDTQMDALEEVNVARRFL